MKLWTWLLGIKKSVLFKVDLEKAYDCVNWEFLRSIRIKMGFVSTWMQWIDASIFNCHLFILVNESPTNDFEVGRGLRQGDPISPFLFLIIAKDLLGLIKKALDMGDFKWFKVDEETLVELIQFVDDTIFIRGGGWKHLWSIKVFLRGFEPVSRQGVNFHKSGFICINVRKYFLLAA